MPVLLLLVVLLVLVVFEAVVLVLALGLFAPVFVVVVVLRILVRCPRRVLFDGDDPGEPDPDTPPFVVAVNIVVDGFDDLLGLVLLGGAFVVLDDPADVVAAVG